VSVGNLTTGGTGKTPLVMYLARVLKHARFHPAVLTRGYKGKAEQTGGLASDGSRILLQPEECGDEAYLMAGKLEQVPIAVGRARRETARLIPGFGTDEKLVFLLDDGYQHLRVQRDLNLLLLDCARPFGNGRTLPAGALREPVSAAGRADLVIYTRCDGREPGDGTGKLWCAASHRLTGAIPLGGGEAQPLRALEKLRGIAFAGIADPAPFFDSLESEGLLLVATLAFPDHCSYGEDELAAIVRLKEASRSDYLITTGKDAVKLIPHLDRLGTVYTAALEMRFTDSRPLEAALEKLL